MDGESGFNRRMPGKRVSLSDAVIQETIYDPQLLYQTSTLRFTTNATTHKTGNDLSHTIIS
jgi:hypothetical protein